MRLTLNSLFLPPFVNRVKAITRHARYLLFFSVFTVGIISTAFSQDITREYTIKRKGDVVGHTLFTHASSASTTTLVLTSDVKAWFVVTFQANAREEAVFENEILTRSSIYRKMNGNEKVNKTTTLNGNRYLIRKGSKQEILDSYPIHFNLLSLYAFEPKRISKVYSDNYEKFFDVHKIGDQHYKVNFPGGNFTEYFYQNGICVKVHVHHSLYEVVIELIR